MNEDTITRNAGFVSLQKAITGLIHHLAAFNFQSLGRVEPNRLVIRDAVPEDVAEIAHIYGHYVANTAATFEETVPDKDEIHDRWQRRIEEGYPYLVAERRGKIVGFAYAAQFRQRSAFRFMAENSIYVAPDSHKSGIGSALLTTLIERCAELGYRQMVAVIGDAANQGSLALHKKHGFKEIGRLPSMRLQVQALVRRGFHATRLGRRCGHPTHRLNWHGLRIVLPKSAKERTGRNSNA